MPSLRSSQLDVAVILDTSGSISDTEMREFLAEIDAIKAQVRARIVLHACDAELAADGPWEYDVWETFKLPREFHGGAGRISNALCLAGCPERRRICSSTSPTQKVASRTRAGLSGALAGERQGQSAVGRAYSA